jgi:uncharacterized phage protein (TIGR01671 family)
MREIEFRAWYKGRLPYYEGEKLEQCDLPQMIYNVQKTYDGLRRVCETEDKNDVLGHIASFGDILNNENFVVMQYTGLKDKNGKKIFEGDIVKITQWYYDCKDVDTDVSKVIFYENHSCFGYTSRNGNFNMLIGQGLEVEIIGNIYENPELL